MAHVAFQLGKAAACWAPALTCFPCCPLPGCSFDEQVQNDVALVPDGFVYLRAQPGTCMQRLRKR